MLAEFLPADERPHVPAHSLENTAPRDTAQGGPVYFSGGTLETADAPPSLATRVITVQAGKALYFPILERENDNWLCFDASGDDPVDPVTEAAKATIPELQAHIAVALDSATNHAS